MPLLFCGLYTDEGGTYFDIANPNISAVLHHVRIAEFNPPGYFVLMWLWSQATGLSEPMLKLPSFLFGLGTVASVYALGGLIYSRATAILASGFTALSITATILSDSARPYALASLLSTLAIIAFVNIFNSKTPARWMVGFWAFGTTLALVHYSGAILIVGLSCAALIIALRDRLWTRFGLFALGVAAVAVTYLPEAPHLLHDSSPLQVRGWLESSQFGGFGSRFLEQLGFVVPFGVMRFQIVAVCLMSILAAIGIRAVRTTLGVQVKRWPTVVVGMTACLLIGALIETLMFMREQRYMFVFAPLGSVLLASAPLWTWNFIMSRSQPRSARIAVGLVSLWLAAGVVSGEAAQYHRLYAYPALSGLRDASLAALQLNSDGRTLFVLLPDASAGVFRYYARNSGNIEVVPFPYRQSAPSAIHIGLAPIGTDNWKIVLTKINLRVPGRYNRLAIVYAPRSLASPSQALQGDALLAKLSETYKEISYHEYAGYQEPATLEVLQPK